MLGKLEGADELLVCDLEAGVLSLNGLGFAPTDTIVVVVDPSRHSIDAARRLAVVATDLSARVVVVANRVGSAADEQAIVAGVPDHEFVVVPEDPGIRRADRDGLAPIDAAPGSSGVLALSRLAAEINFSDPHHD